MMQDNSKPCFFTVKDRYEMMDLTLIYPPGSICYVTDENKCFTQMIDGTFVDYDTISLKSSVKPEAEISLIYPDEDTYRI